MAQPDQSIVDLEAVDEEAQLAAARAGPARLPADRDQLVRPALHRHLHRRGDGALLDALPRAARIPLWICHILVLALGVVIIRKG